MQTVKLKYSNHPVDLISGNRCANLCVTCMLEKGDKERENFK